MEVLGQIFGNILLPLIVVAATLSLTGLTKFVDTFGDRSDSADSSYWRRKYKKLLRTTRKNQNQNNDEESEPDAAVDEPSKIQEVAEQPMSVDVQALRTEFTNLKEALIGDPEAALRVPLLAKDVEVLHGKISDLKADLDRWQGHLKWLYGAIVTLVLAVLGLVVKLMAGS